MFSILLGWAWESRGPIHLTPNKLGHSWCSRVSSSDQGSVKHQSWQISIFTNWFWNTVTSEIIKFRHQVEYDIHRRPCSSRSQWHHTRFLTTDASMWDRARFNLNTAQRQNRCHLASQRYNPSHRDLSVMSLGIVYEHVWINTSDTDADSVYYSQFAQ